MPDIGGIINGCFASQTLKKMLGQPLAVEVALPSDSVD